MEHQETVFCWKCGAQMSAQASFCSKCGSPRNAAPNGGQAAAPAAGDSANAAANFAATLASKERTSGIIWIVIAVLQLLLGLFLGAWVTLIVGLLNLLGGIQSINRSKRVYTLDPGLVKEYENQQVGLIIALIYNLVFGGVIGVIGNIYDFTTRSYVLNNRQYFTANTVPAQPAVDANAPEQAPNTAAGELPMLTIRRLEQAYIVNPDVEIVVDDTITMKLVNKGILTLPLPCGWHKVVLKCGVRVTETSVELSRNKTLLVSFDKVSGRLVAEEVA